MKKPKTFYELQFYDDEKHVWITIKNDTNYKTIKEEFLKYKQANEIKIELPHALASIFPHVNNSYRVIQFKVMDET